MFQNPVNFLTLDVSTEILHTAEKYYMTIYSSLICLNYTGLLPWLSKVIIKMVFMVESVNLRSRQDYMIGILLALRLVITFLR